MPFRITPACAGNSYYGKETQHGNGITPACAGNSHLGRIHTSWGRDHPRVCGEQPRLVNYAWQQQGSPPRVRGTVKLSQQEAELLRITPACAGNRADPDLAGIQISDHPRVCGEQ